MEVNDFFRWPLLRVTEEIEARIRIRNREKELMVSHFLLSSRYEYLFWDQAYRLDKWQI